MPLQTLPETSPASAKVLRTPDLMRVRLASDQTDRAVSLAAGKTTIGSSPQCTVVLPSTECRPLQCVLNVDRDQVEATRWGAGVQLNLRDFSKAIVAVGDRLTIGACEIEFAALDQDLPLREGDAAETDAAPAASAPPATQQTAATDLHSADELPLESTPAVGLSASAARIEPTPKLTAPAAIAACPSSQTFADKLILQLWQQADRSRRRAQALVAATRDARFRAGAMAADLAAMEIELDLARAAYDSHAADHQQLHLELIKRDRLAAERMAPLAAEVESLRSQLQEAQIELAEQAARCDELSAALAAREESRVADVAADAAEASRVAELEQSLAVQIEQATWLAHELGAVRTELDNVRSELEQQATRRQELELELATAQAAEDSWRRQVDAASDHDATIAQLRSEVEGLHDERAATTERLSEAQSEIDRLNELCRSATDRIAELEHDAVQPVPATAAATAGPNSDGTASLTGESAEIRAEHESAPLAALDEVAWNLTADSLEESSEHPAIATDDPPPVWIPAAEPVEAAAELDSAICPEAPAAETIAADDGMPCPLPAEPAATIPLASELAPTSFIDKYRHLLDDDGDHLSAGTAPQIDDEYLSPAKAADHTEPADDSDDALDAYMASMMQRMRSCSSPSLPEPAPAAASFVAAADPAPLDYDPSIPFDLESMKQGRRAPASTDLAALREIANDSARLAIETHRKKRSVDSAIGKLAGAFAACATAALLMWSASSPYDWQFSAGAALGLVGLGVAALAWRRSERSGANQRGDASFGDFAADGAIRREV